MGGLSRTSGQGDEWRTLTADREKFALYAEDPSFRQGLAHAHRAFGPSVGQVLRRYAILVIQPDCVAARMAGTCVDFARKHAFQPVYSLRFRFDPGMVDALWNYQSNISTRDSLVVSEHLCGRADSLLVLFRDTAPLSGVPSSLRLTDLKGPSNPAGRTRGHLRHLIGSPNRLVVLVHTPDEPIDLIRESVILCGSEVGELYAVMSGRAPEDAESVLAARIEQLCREQPAHDLNPGAALDRLTVRLAEIMREGRFTETASLLAETLESARRGGTLDWTLFAARLREVGVDPLSWDCLLVGSEHIEYDLEGTSRLVERIAAERWLEGEDTAASH